LTTTTAHRRAPRSGAAPTRSADTTAAIAHALATTRDTNPADLSQPAGQSPEPPGTPLGHTQADTERGLTVYPDGLDRYLDALQFQGWARELPDDLAEQVRKVLGLTVTADDRAGLPLGDPTAWV
jgi:hypothetical protein